MVWTNQSIRLYHGTHCAAFKAIRSDGAFRLDLARQGTDFGRGIYTTTNSDQALKWAKQSAQLFETRTGERAEARVIVANIDRLTISRLSILFFTRAHSDFWDIVYHCRAGNNHAVESGWYDIVAGSLSRFPGRGIFRGRDQISFHTDTACTLLFDSIDWSV